MAITQPPILFDKPFADAGDKTIIPSVAGAAGKANLQEGFPPITQVPLASGGQAPDRLDFNGILYMLSAYAHWMQSGGMFTWSDTLDYAAPSIVYQDGEFYACLAESGPGTTAGAQDPATAAAYWGDIGGDVVFDKLATARLISTDPTQTAGKLFDGSANIAIGVAPSLTDGAASPTLPPVGTPTALTTILNIMRNNLKYKINNNDFTQSFAANGWTKLPNGLILQWGKALGAPTTFPIAFPNACLQVILCPQYNSSASINAAAWYVGAMSKTQFLVGIGSAPLPYPPIWVAIGY